MRRAAPRQPRQNRSGELTQIHVRCAGVRKTLIFGYSGLLIESRMSASGQQRKSAEVAGMSAPGGKADVDFGRLGVRL